MNGAHCIEVEAAGDLPTVTKSARGTAARRLRVEATALAAARHPGVVRVVEGSPTSLDDGTVVLRTHFVGSRTLATLGPVDATRAAGLIASLAATVADLHDMGIVHRRLTADHVVLASDGRPILCGFAEAGKVPRAGQASADDVEQLGTLLRDLVADAPAELEEPPSRRLVRRRSDTHLRGALLNLADQATADEWGRRPTARQLAAAISSTAPGASLPAPMPQIPGPPSASTTTPVGPALRSRRSEDPHVEEAVVAPPRRPSLRRPGMLVGAASATVLVVGIAVPLGGADDDTPPAPVSAPPPTVDVEEPPPLTDGIVTPTTSASTVPPGPNVTAAAGCASLPGTTLSSTSSGDPCPTSMFLEHGRLVIDGAAFELGLVHAAVAVGDYRCDGEVELAVVDLDAGHVTLFDGWARPDQPVHGASVARIDSPRQVLAEPLGDGCHRLAVLDVWGIRHVVDPGATETQHEEAAP